MGIARARPQIIHTTMPELNRVENNLRPFLEEIIKTPILRGKIVKGVDLVSANATAVNHGLGRRWTGYLVISQNVAGSVYAPTTQNAENKYASKCLYLRSSANMTCDLWVF